MSEVYYVYGIVPAGSDPAGAPSGIDGRKVELIPAGAHAALTSRVEFSDYTPIRIEPLAGDVSWVRDRAAAHDRVLTWASDTTQVIPFPMWTLFHSAAAVGKLLSEREADFGATFARIRGGREFTVRVYVKTNELRAHLGEHSAEFREMEGRLEGASPGQRYLLERKLDKERKDAARTVTRRAAGEIHNALSAASMDAVREEIGMAAASEHGHAVLNASYLVAGERLVDFQKELTDFVGRYRASGFTFDFTGPWPPYHFVGSDSER